MKSKCPFCDSENDLSAENIGKKIVCSHCSREYKAENPNLQPCPDCFAMISRRARTCPHCGAPLQPEGQDKSYCDLTREETLLLCHPSSLNYILSILICIICAVIAVGCLIQLPHPYSVWGGGALSALGIGIFLQLWIRIYFTEYRITDLRVISCRGLIARKQAEIWIRDMRGVKLQQSFWERLLNIGNIAIGTAATAGEEIILIGVDSPQKIVNRINSLRH